MARTFLVTGGTSGIGLATAELIAERGANVVVIGRNPDRGRAAASLLAKKGRADYLQADVASLDQVQRAIERILEIHGRLDGAVNAAALPPSAPLPTAEQDEGDVDATFAADLKGVWNCLRHEIRALLKGGGGAIVNVSSVNGFRAAPMAAAYTAAKHGVHGLTRAAAIEYAGRGIRVNAVCPGAFRTPMLEGVFQKLSPGSPESAETAYRSHIPLGRLGEPREAATAIAWLLSEEASYVTGAILTVDGGLSAG